MLDHVFLDAIGAVRRSLEDALLERHAFEEHFQIDVLLGDATWETSYTLPGEGMVARVAVVFREAGGQQVEQVAGAGRRVADLAADTRDVRGGGVGAVVWGGGHGWSFQGVMPGPGAGR